MKKKDAKPMKVANKITKKVIDKVTGEKANFKTKEAIVEVFKDENIITKINQNLDINNRLKNNNILRFY